MKKYKVPQEFMDGLEEWRSNWNGGFIDINKYLFEDLPNVVDTWIFEFVSNLDKNKRIGAIINWINGEDVFEVGTPKYVVQRKDAVLSGVHQYLNVEQNGNVHLIYGLENATRFDDFEKASEWYNKHFEVVEVYENEL